MEINDEKLFKHHIRQINDSIFSFSRAIDVLERDCTSSKEQNLILRPVIEALQEHIEFKKKLISEGQKWLTEELNKKES